MTTICRHIKINGERCGSPALHNQPYCYFHRILTASHPHLPAPVPGVPGQLAGWGGDPGVPGQLAGWDGDPTREPHLAATQPTLNLPALEDRESIQLAASIIIGALARNTLDTRRAAVLLYGLQVASANARKLNHSPSLNYIVTETVLTPAGDEIALDEDPLGEIAYQEFLHNLDADDDEEEDDADSELNAA
jgi:hypothetical protein